MENTIPTLKLQDNNSGGSSMIGVINYVDENGVIISSISNISNNLIFDSNYGGISWLTNGATSANMELDDSQLTILGDASSSPVGLQIFDTDVAVVGNDYLGAIQFRSSDSSIPNDLVAPIDTTDTVFDISVKYSNTAGKGSAIFRIMDASYLMRDMFSINHNDGLGSSYVAINDLAGSSAVVSPNYAVTIASGDGALSKTALESEAITTGITVTKISGSGGGTASAEEQDYIRVGNKLMISGSFTYVATSANSNIIFSVTAPVLSGLTLSNASGTTGCSSPSAVYGGILFPNNTTTFKIQTAIEASGTHTISYSGVLTYN
jgi:hypothetical protein